MLVLTAPSVLVLGPSPSAFRLSALRPRCLGRLARGRREALQGRAVRVGAGAQGAERPSEHGLREGKNRKGEIELAWFCSFLLGLAWRHGAIITCCVDWRHVLVYLFMMWSALVLI